MILFDIQKLQINANISATPILNQVRICNPFSGQPDYNYEPGKCSSNTIQIGDIPTVSHFGSLHSNTTHCFAQSPLQ